MKNYKSSPQRWSPSLTRGSYYRVFTGKNSVWIDCRVKGGNRLWEKKQSPIFQTNLNQISEETRLELVKLNHLLTGMTVGLGLTG